MNDLIRRSDVIDELMHIIPYKRYHNGEYVLLLDKRKCLKAIKGIPAANRPQGEWIKATGVAPPEFTGRYICSNCGYYALMDMPYGSRQELSHYCPDCGARMKGTNDER